MELKKKTLIWEENNEPPKNYIWVKGDGKAYEYDYISKNWIESKSLPSSGNNSSSIGVTEVTYDELVNLRQQGQLVPGNSYRITDYVTTTVQENTRATDHYFDIIVIADTENTLNENARACKSERDTEGYFNEAYVEGWILRYTLDNDTNRFQWADSENGKGVIYYMKDEWNNECGYDFKNIQFKRYAVLTSEVEEFIYNEETNPICYGVSYDLDTHIWTMDKNIFKYYYTFSVVTDDIFDSSIVGNNIKNVPDQHNPDEGTKNNIIKSFTDYDGILKLNDIVIIHDGSEYIIPESDNNIFTNCAGITLGSWTEMNTFAYVFDVLIYSINSSNLDTVHNIEIKNGHCQMTNVYNLSFVTGKYVTIYDISNAVISDDLIAKNHSYVTNKWIDGQSTPIVIDLVDLYEKLQTLVPNTP